CHAVYSVVVSVTRTLHFRSSFFLPAVPLLSLFLSCSFFFNDPAPTEIYTLSLHDALPISQAFVTPVLAHFGVQHVLVDGPKLFPDRKSTRLNSSHGSISYAVFCLKKKNVGKSLEVRHAKPRGQHDAAYARDTVAELNAERV